MTDHDDWDDDLVRALRAPGSSDELAGEEQAVAAFLAQRPRGRLTRVVRRLGAGGTAVVVVVGVSGGVAAAAYTRTLPDPVQRIVHQVVGSVAAPAPRPTPSVATPSTRPPGAPAPSNAPPVAPSTTPTSAPPSTAPASRAPTRPHATHSAPATPPVVPTPPAPTARSTPPTPSPPADPTAPSRRPPVAGLTLLAVPARVAVGSTLTVTAYAVATDGRPARHRPVSLLVRTAGGHWTRVARARTDRDGGVELATGPLTATSRVRVRTPTGVRSAGTRVVVVPGLGVTVARSHHQATLTVTATGGRDGDALTLLRRTPSGLVVAARGSLDAAGRARFTVTPPTTGTDRYVVRLARTSAHAAAHASARVRHAKVSGDDTGPAPHA